MPKPTRLPDLDPQRLLREARVRLATRAELPRLHRLLKRHHYLGSLKPVGERLFYVATDAAGQWLAVLVFSAAAKHLRARDQWIGWTDEQRRRRLSLLTNNSRFLLLPGAEVPNLGSRVLRLTLSRLSQDWQAQYGHPILAVETFVDPDQFDGTVYSAQGWIELGQTDGWGRCRRDYYVKHDQPKRLFLRPLQPEAARSLQAEHLKPSLAVVEAKVPARLHPPGQGDWSPGRALQVPARVPRPHRILPPVQPGHAHPPGDALRGAPRADRPGEVRAGLQPGPATGLGDSA